MFTEFQSLHGWLQFRVRYFIHPINVSESGLWSPLIFLTGSTIVVNVWKIKKRSWSRLMITQNNVLHVDRRLTVAKQWLNFHCFLGHSHAVLWPQIQRDQLTITKVRNSLAALKQRTLGFAYYKNQGIKHLFFLFVRKDRQLLRLYILELYIMMPACVLVNCVYLCFR